MSGMLSFVKTPALQYGTGGVFTTWTTRLLSCAAVGMKWITSRTSIGNRTSSRAGTISGGVGGRGTGSGKDWCVMYNSGDDDERAGNAFVLGICLGAMFALEIVWTLTR